MLERTSTHPKSVPLRRRLGFAVATVATLAGTFAIGTAPAQAAAHHKAFFVLAGTADGHQTVIAHGAIEGGGRDVASNKHPYDTVHLGGGTIRLRHPNKTAKFKIVTFHQSSCYYKYTLRGTYTLGHGTGRFAGVTGKGHYKGTGHGIAARRKNGACNMNARPRAEVFIVHAHGPVSLP